MRHKVTKCPPVGLIVKFCRTCQVLSQTCTAEIIILRNDASKTSLSRIQAGCVYSDSEPHVNNHSHAIILPSQLAHTHSHMGSQYLQPKEEGKAKSWFPYGLVWYVCTSQKWTVVKLHLHSQ